MKLFLAFALGAVAMAALYALVVCVLSLAPSARPIRTTDQPVLCVPSALRDLYRSAPVCAVIT